MKTRIPLLLCALLGVAYSAHATTLVGASGASFDPNTFDRLVTAKAFNRATGDFFVGTGDSLTTSNFSVAKANRKSESIPSIFTSLVSNDGEIEFLTLATGLGNTNPNVPYVFFNTNEFSQTIVNIVNSGGNLFGQSSDLRDFTSTLNTNGATTAGIVALAASSHFVFAGVRPNGGNFGSANGGIAVIKINPTTLTLTQTPAVLGDSGIKAQKLDSTLLPQLGTGTPTIASNIFTMQWDDRLDRLYGGLEIENSANGVAISVVVAQVDAAGHLIYSDPFAPTGVFVAGELDKIIGVTDMATQTVNAFNLRVMHTSPGPSYLIVNGGNGTSAQTGGKIFALPLVDSPASSSHGLLASKNSNPVSGKFVTPVTVNADLPDSDDPAVVVGAGRISVNPTEGIFDIFVSGDTVYVSIALAQDPINETGILYSQALFDETGKVVRWTPWTRRAFPINGFPTQCPTGPVAFFAVDAVNDVVWAVDGNTQEIVRTTCWEESGSSLVNSLNGTLTCGGSASVLDLDQSTRGFLMADGQTTSYRYALFGGNSRVAIAQVSKSINTPNFNGPQEVTLDFAQAGRFLETILPEGAGLVTSLEYARQMPGSASNYFFAGTTNGFYVFDDGSGNGFNAAALGLLNQAPFINHNWVQINTIQGAITDIKTTGNALYVLVYNTSCNVPMQSTLLRIPFATTTAAMFAASNISTIAQTGTGVFSNMSIFNGIQIISTNDSTQDQIVLATNRGLYISQATGGVNTATNQTLANWIPANINDPAYYNGIGAVCNANITGPGSISSGAGAPPTTVWPFSFRDKDCQRTFTRSSLQQFVSTGAIGGFAFQPSFFNSSSNTAAFTTLPQITKFWSDGDRRMAIVVAPGAQCETTGRVKCYTNVKKCSINSILSLPFNATEWNISNPDLQIIQDKVVETACTYFWIKDIGVTGLLLAGNERGVFALQ